LAIAILLLCAVPAFGDLEIRYESFPGWDIEYILPGTVRYYVRPTPPGTYALDNWINYVTVYKKEMTPYSPIVIWNEIGMYGAPALGQPQAVLPESFPQITFTSGVYGEAAIVYDTGGGTIGTPEFSILRRLPRFPEVTGRLLTAKLAVRHGLQYVTAWGATGLLKAMLQPVSLRGLFIDWAPFTFEIEPWCAGTNTLKLLLGIGLVLAIVLRPGWGPGLALVGLAGFVAIEANILRVTATALLYQQIGRAAWGWKDWIGGATTALALLQVVGPAWVIKR
jgi:exosortase/archaeosortase family protein